VGGMPAYILYFRPRFRQAFKKGNLGGENKEKQVYLQFKN